MTQWRLWRAPLLAALVLVTGGPEAQERWRALSERVEIRRTTYGVPHINAQDLAAAGYALAWVQLEDHGANTAVGLLRARGEMARWFGRDSIENDFREAPAYRLAMQKYALLDDGTRQIYEGFAEGVNRYIEVHPTEFPDGFRPRFTGYDVAARDVTMASSAQARAFLQRLQGPTSRAGGHAGNSPADEREPTRQPEDGSNAWAFAPTRTRSGRAILLRNPHLAWTAGYYEAHMIVPGVVDFYGDFRIGGPFGVIGGFNRHLGWSTTNNDPDLDEIYSLDVDPERPDHVLLDDTSVPLERELVTVAFRNGAGLSTETRETWRSPLGPVVLRAGGKVYVVRAAAEGDHRGGEQFLRMMRATSLDEWKAAMRMRSRVTSNFTYADRAGNILYVWNASLPSLPHANGGDTTAIPIRRTSEAWTRYVPWDSLPQVLNPPGGYVRNENDAPYHTNLNAILDRSRYPANAPEPTLRLRSQLSLQLVGGREKLDLERVMELKHSYRMLLADRVKPDLITAVRGGSPSARVTEAIEALAKWDNTSGPASRGGVLFEAWWRRYTEGRQADSMFAEPWRVDAPASTPRGLREPARAAEAFTWAVDEVERRHGSWNPAWGEVHRVRRGAVDEPVGGCSGTLGCFRVLNFAPQPDGRRAANGGDGWILAVEFTDVPRAVSVLAYGQSPRPESPHHADQAAMFARGQYKRIAFTDADIEAQTIRRYRPGQQP